MARPAPTAEDGFLAPLRQAARRHPDIETLVFWHDEDGNWTKHAVEEIDAEEASYYAEGLLGENFRLLWRLIAAAGESVADHARLYVWEDGLLSPEEGAEWQSLAESRWPL